MCTRVLYASLSVTLRCTRTRVCRGVRDRVHAHGLNLCKQLKVHTRTRESISRTRNVGLTVYFWQQERRTERKGKEEEEVEREWWRNGDETTGSGGEVWEAEVSRRLYLIKEDTGSSEKRKSKWLEETLGDERERQRVCVSCLIIYPLRPASHVHFLRLLSAARSALLVPSSFHPDFLANFPRPSQRLISLLLSVLCSSPSFCFSLIFFRFLSRSLAHFLPNSRRSQKSSPTRRHSVLSFFLVSFFFVGRFRRLENCESRQRMSPYITFKLFN